MVRRELSPLEDLLLCLGQVNQLLGVPRPASSGFSMLGGGLRSCLGFKYPALVKLSDIALTLAVRHILRLNATSDGVLPFRVRGDAPHAGQGLPLT